MTDLSTTQSAIEAAAAAALRAFAPVTAGTAGGPGGHRSGGCHLDAELHDCEIVLRLLRDPQNLGLLWEHLSLYDSKLRRHPQDFWVGRVRQVTGVATQGCDARSAALGMAADRRSPGTQRRGLDRDVGSTAE